MNNLLTKIKNYNLVQIFLAVITYCAILKLGLLKSYNIVSWLVLLILILFYIKADIFNNKYKKDITLFSIFFSFLLTFGNIVYCEKNNPNVSFLRELVSLNSLIIFIGIFNLLYIVLYNILPKLVDYKIKKNLQLNNKKLVIVSFLIIFLCWLPYFLNYFPGILTSDSISELTTVINNFSVVSDHHPVIHTLFVAGPYNIGFKIFNSVTVGVAFSSVVQMIIMASIFSSLIVFLNKRNINRKILLLILGYYAILPMHGFYSITMWKDIVFSGVLLLLVMECIKLLEKKEELKFKNFTTFIVVSIFCIFFRNNAIYMYFLLFIFSLIIFRKKIKYFICAFSIVFCVYFVVKGPVFNYFNVSKSASAEYIGMPLQQIGRMAFKNVEFSDYEKKYLNKLIPIEVMAKSYNPGLTDGIKFNKNYNGKAFDDNKTTYFKIWLDLVRKYPSISLEAYAASTLGYWYPSVEPSTVAMSIESNSFNLEKQSKLPEVFNKIFTKIENINTPLFNIEWSIGLCFWIILIFCWISIKRKKSIYPYIPIFGIWITMMIASPAFAEFRYVYGAFTCLPLLMITPYINFENKD